MAAIYLAPQDVNRRDGEVVLAFLNRAQSAEEIASRVEIPHELDIGIKLGERLLHARAQLQEIFTDLEQIYAIPYIGPERFTEIVTTLTGRTALEILSRAGENNSSTEIGNVSRQLDMLRRQMQDLQLPDPRRYRIECTAVGKAVYLGEIITLKFQVFDRTTNITQANMPLTLETNWGHLRYQKGYLTMIGSVISARTGVDGQLICQLYPPTCEPLTESQHIELANALAKLTKNALVPADMEKDFHSLASLYQHPLNRDLRAAIDIHYKSRQARLLDTVNRSSALYGWNYEQVLLRVYLHPDEETEKTAVLAMAVLPLEYRDWLLPWYNVYTDGLNRKNELPAALEHSLAYSDSERGLASQMLADMQTFIARQYGLVGERAAQHISREVVASFLPEKLAGLSDNSKLSLLTLLREAPSTMKASGSGQIGVASQVMAEVGRTEGFFDYAAFDDRLARFNGDLQSFRRSVDNFNTIKNQLIANVTEGVNAALHTLETTGATRVTIKPIDNVNLNGIVDTRPPTREP
jgi:hypothetical protein